MNRSLRITCFLQAATIAIASLVSLPEDSSAATAVVSSATPEATDAGIRVLQAGGNAVDAAAAVSLALGVTEPMGSGIFGQTYMLIDGPDTDAAVIHGSTLAPNEIPDAVVAEDVDGRRASTVPSTLRVLDLAVRQFGSGRIEWSDLVQPAIELAEQGFELGEFRQRCFLRYADALTEDPNTAEVFLPGGPIPSQGSRIVQTKLAQTLRRIANDGVGDFYSGSIARAIARDMKENGGWITFEDLDSFPEPRITAPLQGSYRGLTVYSTPPPTGGWTVLHALHLLDRTPAEDLAGETAARAVWLVECLARAHEGRRNHPLKNLRDESEAMARISDASIDGVFEAIAPPEASPSRKAGGETTHFTVVDAEGMVVSVTQSINYFFGAKVSHPELGFLYNNYMKEFELDDETSPYFLRPGGLPYSSMSPTVVSRNGSPVLGLGSPGSARIVSAVVQVLSHWVDVDSGIESAVSAPRVHVREGTVYLEDSDPDRRLLLDLEKRGFKVQRPLSSLARNGLNAYFGGVHAVALDEVWTGAADPRRDGTVKTVDLEPGDAGR